jgi:hypothetical protein
VVPKGYLGVGKMEVFREKQRASAKIEQEVCGGVIGWEAFGEFKTFSVLELKR